MLSKVKTFGLSLGKREVTKLKSVGIIIESWFEYFILKVYPSLSFLTLRVRLVVLHMLGWGKNLESSCLSKNLLLCMNEYGIITFFTGLEITL